VHEFAHFLFGFRNRTNKFFTFCTFRGTTAGYKIASNERRASLPVEREPVGKMIATILRDMGLLVLVFMPLDAVFTNAPVPTGTFWQGMGWGVLLVTLGIILERKRT